eukprot:CFRG6376T1
MSPIHLASVAVDISALLQDEASQDEKDRVAHDLLMSTEATGFLQVVNHGLDFELQKKFIREMDMFFTKIPEVVRNAIRRKDNNYRGYFDDELTKQKRDFKRCFDFSRLTCTTDAASDFDGENQWPSEVHVPQFKSVMEEYYDEMRRISLIIIDALVMAMENTIGVHHHNDAGLVTLLYQDNVGGLQVWLNEVWADVPPISNALVLNIGDMMQIFTNGRLKAPLHRVLASATSERFSAPFFFNPAYSADVRPLNALIGKGDKEKYAPVSWLHFRRRRVLGDYKNEGIPEVQVTDFVNEE